MVEGRKCLLLLKMQLLIAAGIVIAQLNLGVGFAVDHPIVIQFLQFVVGGGNGDDQFLLAVVADLRPGAIGR